MKFIVTIPMALLLTASIAWTEPGWMDSLSEAGLDLHGFAESRYGRRMQSNPVEDDLSLHELRIQLDGLWYHDRFTAQFKADFVYDDLDENRSSVDLETGEGWFDLRQFNVLASPLPWMDLKIGRQVLTWGTGDLVFINDLFPKDWPSFFLGRDAEYLKAPSDALLVSMFPGFASIDIAYTPRFDADRYITGERISYWNGQAIVGQDPLQGADPPDDWFEDEEIAARIYRNVGGYEMALYGYSGFWKSPGGVDPSNGKWRFPELRVYGLSARGPLAGGIGNLEAGYYDSAEDRDGDDPFVNNSETRILIGYERELVRDLTVSAQYYLEHMMDYGSYRRSRKAVGLPGDTAPEEDRHTVTLRVTRLLMNQNLVLSCFARCSPSEEDVYVQPSVTYKASDRWQASIGGNIFAGEEEHTFLGQFENNSNLYVSLRCSY